MKRSAPQNTNYNIFSKQKNKHENIVKQKKQGHHKGCLAFYHSDFFTNYFEVRVLPAGLRYFQQSA